MRARLGIWHEEVVIMVDQPLSGNWCIKLWPGSPTRPPSLLLKRSRHAGRGFKRHDEQRALEFPYILRDRECSQVGFARCALTDIELQELKDGDFVAPLPYNHRLPWPEARECDSYGLADELAKCLVLRRHSAKNMGEPFGDVPAHVIDALKGSRRADVLNG